MIYVMVIVASVGLANAITEEYVFEWMRNLIDKIGWEWLSTLVHCVTCMSFWTGLIISSIFIDWLYVVPLALICSIVAKSWYIWLNK